MGYDRSYFTESLTRLAQDLDEFFKTTPDAKQEEIDRLTRGIEHQEKLAWSEKEEKEAEFAVIEFMGYGMHYVLSQLKTLYTDPATDAKLHEHIIKSIEEILKFRQFQPMSQELYDYIEKYMQNGYGEEAEGIIKIYKDNAKKLKRIQGDSLVRK